MKRRLGSRIREIREGGRPTASGAWTGKGVVYISGGGEERNQYVSSFPLSLSPIPSAPTAPTPPTSHTLGPTRPFQPRSRTQQERMIPDPHLLPFISDLLFFFGSDFRWWLFDLGCDVTSRDAAAPELLSVRSWQTKQRRMNAIEEVIEEVIECHCSLTAGNLRTPIISPYPLSPGFLNWWGGTRASAVSHEP